MSYPQKKPKLSQSHNQSHNEEPVAGPSNDESPPKIFKLNIDCFDEIFEYLNVKDLHSFGQTCKRMNKVAGEYFKQNYSSAEKFCEEDGIHTVYSDKDGVIDERIQTSGFHKFMPCISIDVDPYKYINSHISEFESTNHIFLSDLCINNETVERFKKLLPQLEILQSRHCAMDGDFYDLILKYCKNLRRIYVQNSTVGNRINGEIKWLLQKYPKLERLELIPAVSCRIEELREFFVHNPNAQRFSTTSAFLWRNADTFLNSKAKLDILELKEFQFYTPYYSCGKHTLETPLELLNRLHEQGFYKRLYICIHWVDEEESTSFASLNGLELLCISSFEKSYNLTQLTNLRELIIFDGSNSKDMDIIANGLTKLERLYIKWASIDEIMPFIRRSPKLNKIKFIPEDSGVVLNLAMLNEERAKLAGARKIIIYTRDDVFLATKWTTRNGDTNLNFIEMRRADSYDWEPCVLLNELDVFL
ncbi:uncharacterized protein LOC116347394 [Contarinia nasturtii]|uniref:uncharacterized protein LOC116347394 n=1 Tax=Contarinia nasturtii TaxID=265458 RepID=UPI0012D41ADE|nr:uncharacterized protein LOC116347394 [Contarinia nasturtii]